MRNIRWGNGIRRENSTSGNGKLGNSIRWGMVTLGILYFMESIRLRINIRYWGIVTSGNWYTLGINTVGNRQSWESVRRLWGFDTVGGSVLWKSLCVVGNHCLIKFITFPWHQTIYSLIVQLNGAAQWCSLIAQTKGAASLVQLNGAADQWCSSMAQINSRPISNMKMMIIIIIIIIIIIMETFLFQMTQRYR